MRPLGFVYVIALVLAHRGVFLYVQFPCFCTENKKNRRLSAQKHRFCTLTIFYKTKRALTTIKL